MEVLKNNIGDLIITNFNSNISINKSSLEQENKGFLNNYIERTSHV